MRLLDTDLAARLGLAHPLNIRSQIIATNRAELESYGTIFTACAKIPGKAGRPAKASYLTEEQALLVVMFSRTPKAAKARREIISVFQAYRRGEGPSALAVWQRNDTAACSCCFAGTVESLSRSTPD